MTLSGSNHGGRQLEGAISAVQALPEIAEAVGDKLEVVLDGGIRRGADVVRARALGAKACMIGRAWLYGLASGGQPRVERALEILRDEIDVTLTLLGRPTLPRSIAGFCRANAPAFRFLRSDRKNWHAKCRGSNSGQSRIRYGSH